MPRSTSYYRPSEGKPGARPSTHTPTKDGGLVDNQQVVNTLVEEVFSQEFNCYGHRLACEELKDRGFIINHKKVYRLMKENNLLLKKPTTGRGNRQWVKYRTITEATPYAHVCMDIKCVYIHGERRNAFLLAIIDVATRCVLSWSIGFTMKHSRVILALHQAMQGADGLKVIIRTDNGSQFIAKNLAQYCHNKGLNQEFTHVATPQENSYVESLFSCIEREVIQRYQFDSLHQARETFIRYFKWHNTKRRRHALGRKSPLNHWHTAFPSHPVSNQLS